MIIAGKSIAHGAYLAQYLREQRDNDQEPEVFRIKGTATPDNYQLSADEIAMSGMLSRGDKNVYHLQINPGIGEDRLTDYEKDYCIDSCLRALGMEGQKHYAVEHVKNGRWHMHVGIDRYDWKTRSLKSDSHDWKKLQSAAEEISQQLGHRTVARKPDYKKAAVHKEVMTDLWYGAENGRDFIDQARELKYYVAKGLKNHPWRVITPDGKSLNLAKQIKGIKAADLEKAFKGQKLMFEADALKLVDQENKRAIQAVNEDFLSNFKEDPELDEQEGREKEKKNPSRPETEISALEDDVELIREPEKEKLSDRIKRKREERERRFGKDHDQDFTL